MHGNIINPFAAYIILQTSHGSQGFYPWILWRQLVSGFQTYKGLIAFFRFRKLRIKKTQSSNQTLEVYTWNSSHKVTLARYPVSHFLLFTQIILRHPGFNQRDSAIPKVSFWGKTMHLRMRCKWVGSHGKDDEWWSGQLSVSMTLNHEAIDVSHKKSWIQICQYVLLV